MGVVLHFPMESLCHKTFYFTKEKNCYEKKRLDESYIMYIQVEVFFDSTFLNSVVTDERSRRVNEKQSNKITKQIII